jgi:hypothetical protein
MCYKHKHSIFCGKNIFGKFIKKSTEREETLFRNNPKLNKYMCFKSKQKLTKRFIFLI